GDGITPVPAETVFKAAGFDLSRFTGKTPGFHDRFAHDQQLSWSGPHPVIPGVTVNMDIGWWKGRVTLARAELKFPDSPQKSGSLSRPPWLQWFVSASLAVGVFFGVLLARKNWKAARSDRKGALRLAWVVLILGCAEWIGTVHPVVSSDMLDLFFSAAGEWLFAALVMWLLYLALEPEVRARWPHSLVSWNRVLAGKWLDAQVGSHILIGAATGCALWTAVNLIEILQSSERTLDAGMNLTATLGIRQWIEVNAIQMLSSLIVGLVGFFVIFGLRVLPRRDILAAVAASVLFTVTRPDIFDAPHLLIALTIWVVLYAALIFTLLRFGLVATIAAVFFIDSYQYITVGTAFVSWMTPPGLATLTLLLGIAAFAFWRSLGSRELLGGGEGG